MTGRPVQSPEELLGTLMRQFHLRFVNPDQTIEQTPPTVVRNYLTQLRPLRNSTVSLPDRETWIQDNVHKLLPGLEYHREPDAEEPEGVLSGLTLDAIQAEATRAHILHGEQSMFGRHNRQRRLAILTEEFGEAAEELERLYLYTFIHTRLAGAIGQVARHHTYDSGEVEAKLVKELVQVAAMAASWIEAIEGEHRNVR